MDVQITLGEEATKYVASLPNDKIKEVLSNLLEECILDRAKAPTASGVSNTDDILAELLNRINATTKAAGISDDKHDSNISVTEIEFTDIDDDGFDFMK